MSTPVPNVLLPAKKRRKLPPRVTFWYNIQPWETYVVDAETVTEQPVGWLPSVAKTREQVKEEAAKLVAQLRKKTPVQERLV